MTATSSISIRRARREDVEAIVRMLADDPLGSGRERIEESLLMTRALVTIAKPDLLLVAVNAR
jgi:hypothetical protein